jgi:hypothetical protein
LDDAAEEHQPGEIKTRLQIPIQTSKFYLYYKIILTGEPEGKRPLGKPRRRWEDNIRIDLK